MTTPTQTVRKLTKFEGFSPTLKKQSVEIKCLGVSTVHNQYGSNNLTKIEILRLTVSA